MQAMQSPKLAAIMLAASLALFSGQSLAANAAKVVVAKGAVNATSGNQTRALKRRSDVMEKDSVTTGADSRTQLRFVDGALLTLNDDAELFIDEYSYQAGSKPDKVLMKLVRGGFRTVTGAIGKTNKEAYQVDTPLASIGIRGTLYSVLYNAATEVLEVIVLQGSIVVFNQFGTVEIHGGGNQSRGGRGSGTGGAPGTPGDSAGQADGEDGSHQHNAVRVRKGKAPEPYTVETGGSGPVPPQTFQGPGDPDNTRHGTTEQTEDGDSSFHDVLHGSF